MCCRIRRQRFHRRSIKAFAATQPQCGSRSGAVWLRSASSISAMAEVEVYVATVLPLGRRFERARRQSRAPAHRQTNHATALAALAFGPRSVPLADSVPTLASAPGPVSRVTAVPGRARSAKECEDPFLSNPRLVEPLLQQRCISHISRKTYTELTTSLPISFTSWK